jgi:hypothetical protein
MTVIEPGHNLYRSHFRPRRSYSQPRVAELREGAPLGHE